MSLQVFQPFIFLWNIYKKFNNYEIVREHKKDSILMLECSAYKAECQIGVLRAHIMWCSQLQFKVKIPNYKFWMQPSLY